MSNETLQTRDGFKSQWGFILACIGSAVGMGNIWRFPIMVAKYGGMTFLLPYFLFVVLVGSSGVIAAMVLGFLEYWSLIEQPLTFLKEKKLFPLSVFLPDITSVRQSGMAFAASVVTFLPALLVFLGGQDYLEKGIMAGAVKE